MALSKWLALHHWVLNLERQHRGVDSSYRDRRHPREIGDAVGLQWWRWQWIWRRCVVVDIAVLAMSLLLFLWQWSQLIKVKTKTMLKAFYQLLGEENKGHRTKCMIVKKKQLIVTTGTITWATSKSIVSVQRKKKWSLSYQYCFSLSISTTKKIFYKKLIKFYTNNVKA